MAITPTQIAQSLGQKKTNINTTATFLIFEAGLYTISFTAKSSGSSDLGLRLPCARLDTVPIPGGGEAFVTTVPVGGWISTQTGAAHVLVVGGRAGGVLTIYRSADAVDMPVVEFRSVLKAQGGTGSTAVPPTQVDTRLSAVDVNLTVNLQDGGELRTQNGAWSQVRDPKDTVEGFQLAAIADGKPIEIEYQGFMGKDWFTQWFKHGQYCGSRGLRLPMLGFRMRLPDDLARTYSLQYWGVFDGGGAVGPVAGGDLCHSGQRSLISMKVEIVPSPVAATPVVPTKEPAKRKSLSTKKVKFL